MTHTQDLRERLEELCLLANQGGDPIREPRRSHIARYYCALSEAWLKGALVPAPAVPDDVAGQVARHLAVQMRNAGYDEAAEYMLSEWIGNCIRAALQPTGDA